MEIELFEILNDASVDSLVWNCLEEAGIDKDNEKYDDCFDAIRGAISSMSIELPSTKEDIYSLL